MTIRVLTRHSEDFDIYTSFIDPTKSPYLTCGCKDYVGKIRRFYSQLGIATALWATPESQQTKIVERDKPVEYLLEINEDRIIAYVDSVGWSEFLFDKWDSFEYSTAPKQLANMSILVAPPVRKNEVKARRRFGNIRNPQKYDVVEEAFFSLEKPFEGKQS